MRIVHPPEKNKLLVRNYSVNEHFRLMGFKDGELDFNDQSYQQLCKRAANGWDINLASKIFEQIFYQDLS
jgi:DNA (cytosine-5)-methyltransferase 1